MSATRPDHASSATLGGLVPNDVIPHGKLPPMTWRDMPEPISLRRMIGPSIILAGLALGSGEFILWPYITYKSQFIFFWACFIGVTTQYFLNMEITRWTLATGESAVTGFMRLSKHWAWVFLLLNIIPWMIPAWSKGAAQLVSWLIWGPQIAADGSLTTLYETPLAIAGMVFCGMVLTAGPVIYETVERVQMLLVSLVLILVVILAAWLLWDRPDAILAQWGTLGHIGAIPAFDAKMTPVLLLGALAFAGAGGTTNLGQGDYIKDKGYGMGHYIGRITSPVTGQQEAISEVGSHFPPTEENLRRWRAWWRAASWEHLLSFYLTCMVCLMLLTLIAYVLFYDAAGQLVPTAVDYGDGILFVWGEAQLLTQHIGAPAKLLFLVMGVAILLTTEFGVLDVASRISTDIVKVAWLRDNPAWSESRLYYFFLWGMITLGSSILLLGQIDFDVSVLQLFKFTAAMNGGVMFLYSGILLYLNLRVLPKSVRMSIPRMLIMIWTILFFGFFSVWAMWDTLSRILAAPAS